MHFFAVEMAPVPGIPVRRLTIQDLRMVSLTYEDIILAADAVVSKPGYGIVSDCLANGTPLVYLERPDFREYGPLVAGIEQHVSARCLTISDLQNGGLLSAVEEVLTLGRRQSALPLNGADAVAQAILGMLAS